MHQNIEVSESKSGLIVINTLIPYVYDVHVYIISEEDKSNVNGDFPANESKWVLPFK